MITQRGEIEPGVEVEEMTDAEAWAMLDREARQLLNVGAEEFVRRWHAGDYRDSTDPRVTHVAMLLPDAW